MSTDRDASAADGIHINVPFWILGRILTIPVFRLGYRLRIEGREHIPEGVPVMIVSNHRSFLDPPFIGYAASPRRAYYMAKHIIFRHASFAWLITSLGAFPVRRERADRNAIRIARGLLRRRECIVMFPEGTRGMAENGEMLFGMPGAGLLAFEPDVVVLPAAIWDSRRKLGPVRLRFGPPLDLSDIPLLPRNRRNRMATDRMMVAIAALLDELGGASGIVQPSDERVTGSV